MITRIEKDGKVLTLNSSEAASWWKMTEKEQDEFFNEHGLKL